MARILLVDNEPSILSVLSTLLRAEEYDVVALREGSDAIDHMRSDEFDLLISDIRMKPIGGMDLLKIAREEKPNMAVIMLTAFGTVETAIDAMKLGAFDYVTKPFKVDELLITIQRALDYRNAITENISLKDRIKTQYRFDNIVAESPSMKNVCSMIEKVAPTDTTIMIYGESGTGKELVAKAIHSYSNRRNKKFMAVNCAALPEPLLESEMFGHVKGSFTGASQNRIGLFEAAKGGTIFLDEIGSMPLSIQSKLLRVLQEKEVRKVGDNKNIPVNARVLTATNNLLEDLIKEGKFREDLYYRISVIPINIEPLRKRREDIIPLINHVLQQELHAEDNFPTLTPETEQMLLSYAWPGNVRELENAIKHAITFAHDGIITPETLPPKIVNSLSIQNGSTVYGQGSNNFQFFSLKGFLKKKEKEYLNQVLTICNGNKEKAASTLKISLATLYRKLSENQDNDDQGNDGEDVSSQ